MSPCGSKYLGSYAEVQKGRGLCRRFDRKILSVFTEWKRTLKINAPSSWQVWLKTTGSTKAILKYSIKTLTKVELKSPLMRQITRVIVVKSSILVKLSPKRTALNTTLLRLGVFKTEGSSTYKNISTQPQDQSSTTILRLLVSLHEDMRWIFNVDFAPEVRVSPRKKNPHNLEHQSL